MTTGEMIIANATHPKIRFVVFMVWVYVVYNSILFRSGRRPRIK